MLGFFLNTLPIRVRLEGNPSFRQVLRQVRQTLLEAFGHADLPFEQMVELAVKEREPGQQPLYQAMFVLLEGGLPSLNLDKAEVRRVPMGTGTSKNDLTLSMQAGAQVWDCQFEYAADLFSAESAARMVRHLTELLRSITENSQEPISQLSLMPEKERHQVMVEWNRTERDYPRDKCVHQLFEEQVERTPEAVAVVFEGQSLTYRELNARANQLAHYLRSLGVGPEVLVGLCLERSLEMVVALLGILKAGGAYVPLDPGYPPNRLALMLDDAQVAVLLTQKKLARHSMVHEARVICLDDLEPAALSSHTETNPPNLASPANLAYVIFTSGSTGRPKGVLVTHHNVVRLMRATADWFHFDERDVWTMFHSFAFDFSVWEIWGALLYGGRLVVVPHFVSRSPDAFYELLAAEKVTVLNQTPSAFRQLIQVEAVSGAPRDLALRYVIFGGEALEMQSLQPWFKRHGDARPQLVNMYGITETTVHVTYRPLTKNDVFGPSVIGTPIPDLQIYILDSHRQAVPVGVLGEMFIGGEGLARGYLNQPALTADRFIPHPFSAKPNARLYRTGDLARWLPQGDIEYLGRMDHQVKIRGYRIELGEVEAVLGGHLEVAACAVLAQDLGGGDKTLVAFVVGRQAGEPSVGSLRQWLGEKLPDYMIPSRFVTLPALPLTPNGKLDRKALEMLDGEELATGTEYVAPRDEQERALAEIWQAVLR
ncbi:MAG: amino acid adenylation domain-containing protein, partial [Verrucomicrobia bacterium]|nr:amino acid adenylation domain-containing protein [Verrucomicrobiota bacterium]